MRSSLGIMAVFALAALGALALALAHNAYVSSSTDDAVVSASSRDTYTGNVLGVPTGYLGDLPLGGSQFLTFKSLVVIPKIDHASTIAPGGTGFNVSSGMQPGDSYDIYISLNNASEVQQSAGLTLDLQTSIGSVADPDVI
jgi:hypothetical protein